MIIILQIITGINFPAKSDNKMYIHCRSLLNELSPLFVHFYDELSPLFVHIQWMNDLPLLFNFICHNILRPLETVMDKIPPISTNRKTISYLKSLI
jgi:hypothetical protein